MMLFLSCYCFIYVLTCSPIYMFTLAKFMCKSPRWSICSIVGSSLTFSGLELTETTKRGDVLLPLRRKQWCLCPLVDNKYCLHYVLCLRRYSVVYNLIPRDACWIAVSKWSISYRCCRMAVYIFLLVR